MDDHSHYVFTPRDLTRWSLGLLRYDLADSKHKTADHVLEVWAYEANRLFRDRLVGSVDIEAFDDILFTVLRTDWTANMADDLLSESSYSVYSRPLVR